MAADDLKNPLSYTGGTISSATKITDRLVYIKFIYWHNPTTVGHLAKLTDREGNTILPMNCDAANQSQMWPIWTAFKGVYCDDLDSGELFIFIN